MVISLKKVIQFIQMWVLIIISTVVLYQMLHIIHMYVWREDVYKVPRGQSMKVHASPGSEAVEPWYTEDLNRIRAFFITGE